MRRSSRRGPSSHPSTLGALAGVLAAAGYFGPLAESPAQAQSVVRLDEVVIGNAGDEASSGGDAGGLADPGEVDGYVAKKATAGSKVATPLAEIPQAVSVIGQEELKDRGAQKVDEALRYTPGVFAQPFGYDSDTDWVYIRGFDATQSGMFLDGLQLYQYAFAGITVDPFLLDRIEVLRGPASVLYGGSSAGGIVNEVSKRADGDHHGYVEAGVTDDPNGYVGFDVGDAFFEASPWSYRIVGRVKGGDTQTDYADNFRGVVAPSLLYEPDADTRLAVYATYQYDDQRHTGGFWPYVGTVTAAPYGFVPRDLYYSEPGLDSFRSKQASIGYDLQQALTDELTFRSNTRLIHVERSEYGPYPYDFDTTDNTLYRLNFAHDTKADLVETDNQLVFEDQIGAVHHQLLAGVDYKYYRIDQWQATGPADQLDPIDPVYTDNLGALYDPYVDETLDMNQLGFYAQEQAKFGDGWVLTLNGRYDEVWIDRDDQTATNNDYDREDGSVSGRAGLAYEFAGGLTPYVSVARFFEPQIGTDTAGEPVGPQTGEQYEVGLKYSPTFLDATLTASLFDLTRRNTLQTRVLNGQYVTAALGEVRSRGVEVEANVNLDEAWNVKGAFTAYDLEITEDANAAIVGNRPYLIPEILASAWLNYTVPSGRLKGVTAGAGIRYQGDSYADNENTLKVPDATVFDVKLGYEQDDWGVSLNVNNVFDKEYVSGCQSAYSCAYGEGRTALLKTHFSF
ncbi:TonB-dependent siderophore receptor [Jiella sonneratiae]|uniref:TonB-dependent siderophore receptor n=1 Tax=Jiella sonneratiae TaxID=2816856 RepID=A0ABS3J9P6_9HYPH|nr:TonB-dependent siderophore receptor [Jiella sonneratiae]MBO0905860.1 TonB-dependent siderophore receptor [Jiella sonneratiae]